MVLDEKSRKSTAAPLLTEREREILLRFTHATVRLSKSFVTSNSNLEKGLKEFADRVLEHANESVKLRANDLLTSTKLNNQLLHATLGVFEVADMASFFTSDNQTKYKTFLAILRDIFEMNEDPNIESAIAKLYAAYCRNPEIGDAVKQTVD